MITGHGTGRATPDVSADADPWTGYEEYFTGFSGSPLEDGWGGTSFVAPQLNGATAAIDSLLGRRVGFWNPAIYRFAAQEDSPFTPLDTASSGNDNLYYTGTPGQRYNVGSGLGYPDLADLARDFADPAEPPRAVLAPSGRPPPPLATHAGQAGPARREAAGSRETA